MEPLVLNLVERDTDPDQGSVKMMPIQPNTEQQHWLNSTDLGLPDGEGIFG
jgi:hypothetical protein